jgi:epoxyqueuosine reductase
MIKAAALRLGFDDVGICGATPPPHLREYKHWIAQGKHGTMAYLEDHLPLKEHPDRLLPNCRSIIAVALNYYNEPERLPGQPKIARYALGRDYHKVLRGKLRLLEGEIKSEFPESRTRACVDSAPIMERDYANLAGLGWFGKNTMLINSRRGSWFFIGLLLTDLELTPDLPAIGGCGSCTRCIEACPTGAIVHEDGRWQVDARRCVSYLTIEHSGEIPQELQGGVGDWTFGCDICQEVCPFNEPRSTQPLRARVTGEPDFTPRAWPDLETLAMIEEPEWDVLTRGSPVRRTGVEGLRRNARINLERRSR